MKNKIYQKKYYEDETNATNPIKIGPLVTEKSPRQKNVTVLRFNPSRNKK